MSQISFPEFIFEKIYQEKKALEGKKVIDLSVGFVERKNTKWDIKFNKSDLTYQSRLGYAPLRQAIAEKTHEDYPQIGNKSQVMITTGASQAIYLCLAANLKKGSEVILFPPTYYLLCPLCRILGLRVKRIPLLEKNNFHPDLEKLESIMSKKTKMIILNSPNNPTGTVFSKKELQEIYNMSQKTGSKILIDACLDNFIFDNGKREETKEIFDKLDNCFFVNSFSKNYGVPGLRVGYVISSNENINRLKELQGFINTCLPTLTQRMALDILLNQKPINTKIIEKNISLFCKKINELENVSCHKPQGGLFLFPKFETNSQSTELFQEFAKKKLLCVPGSVFGKEGEKHMRFTVPNSVSIINEACKIIGTVAKNNE